MSMKFFLSLFLFSMLATCQSKSNIKSQKPIGLALNEKINKDSIIPVGKFVELKLRRRIQSIDKDSLQELDVYDEAINSPKSAIYSKDGSKFYINSLEGFTTVVFDSKTFVKLKEIKHVFTAENNSLFKNNEKTVFDYKFKQKRDDYNLFMGKPVESCLSHNGKYLWVTYYRRDWDENAESPSAVAIIDTQTDQIIRVMPSGPLPKMISCSPDNKYIAVTHWGDNTIGIIDVSSNNPNEFNYVSHVVVDYQMEMNFVEGKEVNRDNDCGNCLRGTVFSPDGKYILVAKMGGNGIAIIQTDGFKYLGTVDGMKLNLRHILINNGEIIASSNKFGAVQKANLAEILAMPFVDSKKCLTYDKWQSVNVGMGARTIEVTQDGKYIFACVNNECKIAVIQSSDMTVLHTLPVSKFPVGMALSADSKQLIVTSQGKTGIKKTGNAVTIFDVVYE
jgi:DNA-binding beta-propeller fold protein YncE